MSLPIPHIRNLTPKFHLLMVFGDGTVAGDWVTRVLSEWMDQSTCGLIGYQKVALSKE